MKERFLIREASESVFPPVHPDTGVPLPVESVIAVREELRWNAVTLDTSCCCGVQEFREVVKLIECASRSCSHLFIQTLTLLIFTGKLSQVRR